MYNKKLVFFQHFTFYLQTYIIQPYQILFSDEEKIYCSELVFSREHSLCTHRSYDVVYLCFLIETSFQFLSICCFLEETVK